MNPEEIQSIIHIINNSEIANKLFNTKLESLSVEYPELPAVVGLHLAIFEVVSCFIDTQEDFIQVQTHFHYLTKVNHTFFFHIGNNGVWKVGAN